MIFGTFAEMSPNVKDFVDMAVEYGVEHLGTCMAASTPDVLHSSCVKEALQGSVAMAA